MGNKLSAGELQEVHTSYTTVVSGKALENLSMTDCCESQWCTLGVRLLPGKTLE